MAQIFISYRREDTGIAAAWLYQKLIDRFGKNAVFMDIDTIEIGRDFEQEIATHLQTCRVLLAIIGRHWLSARDAEGQRRLDQPHDFVQFEIATALSMGIRVVPVLVDNATLPSTPDLPSNLAELPKKQAVKLGQDHFEHDAQQLISKLELIMQGQDEAGDAASSPGAQLAEYLRRQVDLYDAQEWTRRSLRLEAKIGPTQPQDAREQLMAWALGGKGSVAILVGDFGSGKTWLARWLARELASRYAELDLIPLVIYLGSLELNAASFDELVKAGMGVLVPGSRFVVLLDGLDELVASAGDKATIARDYFAHLISLIPVSSPVLVTCRTQVFKVLTAWISDLFRRRAGRDDLDRTAEAVSFALAKGRRGQLPPSTPVVLELCALSQHQADQYLSQSGAAQIWAHVKDQTTYQHLAQLPFTLYLLEEALPVLAGHSSSPLLPDLYHAAVSTWLARDREVSRRDPDILMNRLEELARSFFNRGIPQYGPYDDLLVKIGLLRITDTRIDFAHYSMFEYFLARATVRSICQYDSHLLAVLNLVYMYNVNRFMVPLLQRDLAEFCDDIPRGDDRFADAATKTALPGGSLAMSHPVTCGQYASFVRGSAWRQASGYGYWASMETPDGTRAVHGEQFSGVFGIDPQGWALVTPSSDNRSEPCTGMSWYDAFQFSRWVGGRLPTVEESHLIRMPEGEPSDVRFEWTSSWLDERQSLMAVVPSDSVAIPDAGLNPDLRSDQVGFRVVWDSQQQRAH